MEFIQTGSLEPGSGGGKAVVLQRELWSGWQWRQIQFEPAEELLPAGMRILMSLPALGSD